MSKELEVVENNFVNMRRIKAPGGQMIYTVKHGPVMIQLSRDKAEFICRMLADWLDLDVEKKEIMKMIKAKANTKSTKAKPLGV